MLVLPTRTIPQQLIPQINQKHPVTKKMLNGYRNKLTKSLKLILIKNQQYCGQAFCYKLIDEPDLEVLRKFQSQWECVQNLEGYWVVIGKNNVEMFDFSVSRITVEQYNNILEQLDSTDSNLAAKNIFLNIFNSYKDLEQSGLHSLLLSDNINQKHKNQPIIQQQSSNSTPMTTIYNGDNLFKVQVYNNKTGEWSTSDSQTLQLKIKNKKQNIMINNTQNNPNNSNNTNTNTQQNNNQQQKYQNQQ